MKFNLKSLLVLVLVISVMFSGVYAADAQTTISLKSLNDGKANKDLGNVTPATGRAALGLGTSAQANTGTTVGTVPLLDTNGKLNVSMIPAVSFNSSFVATTEVDMLAHVSVVVHDVCIRTDNHKNYILTALPSSVLANWLEFEAPAGAVTNVGANLPLISSGGATPVLSLNPATQSAAGSFSSTDKVKLDSATSENVILQMVSRDGSGNFKAGTITASLNGTASVALTANTAASATTASTAASLTTPRTINGVSFDGNSNIVTQYTGTGTFNSVAGVTISIGATMPNTNYKVKIENTSVTDGSLGDIVVPTANKTVTNFKVVNTGENADGTFDWVVSIY